jgi:SAM-dependent methyltransferase
VITVPQFIQRFRRWFSPDWKERDFVTDEGERVTPGWADWGFYAHLSIYLFAAPFAVDRRVLDAGCGTGYGSFYLAQHGVRSVEGVDYSSKAIAFCQNQYGADNLRFQVMDLSKKLAFEDGSYDVVFSSNVMEHLSNVDGFLRGCCRVLTRQGVLVAAVPPIVTPGMFEANLANRYHVNNLTPLGWFAKLGRFFHTVQGYRHWVKPCWVGNDGTPKDRTLTAEETSIREADFTFEEMSIEELNSCTHNVTAVFVAREPRGSPLPARVEESTVPRTPVANAKPTIKSFAPDKLSPQEVGTKIVWTCIADDPDDTTLYYKFWKLERPGSWVVAQDWSSTNVCVWTTTPDDTGDTVFSAWVRDGHHADVAGCDASAIWGFRILPRRKEHTLLQSEDE